MISGPSFDGIEAFRQVCLAQLKVAAANEGR